MSTGSPNRGTFSLDRVRDSRPSESQPLRPNTHDHTQPTAGVLANALGFAGIAGVFPAASRTDQSSRRVIIMLDPVRDSHSSMSLSQSNTHDGTQADATALANALAAARIFPDAVTVSIVNEHALRDADDSTSRISVDFVPA